MAFNLIRNSRVFFTTDVNSLSGVVDLAALEKAKTQEIQVLDGFTFTQNTTSETVTLNEAGATPVRGQRSFNTALEPVDFSFSTYMRPRDAGVNIDAEEGVLWNAMYQPNGGSAAWTPGLTKATLVTTGSNAHQLVKFGLIIVIDSAAYVIDDCVMDTATIDFGLDAIATIAWTGKGGVLRTITAPTIDDSVPGDVTFSGSIVGVSTAKTTTAPYIANKLSVVSVYQGINGASSPFAVPLTGGSLTLSNNVSYLTPSNLGVVNTPATYFTGTRSITGTMNAYLRTGGASDTGALMAQLLAGSTTDVDPSYNIKIQVGGTTGTHVDFLMPACVLTIPTVNAEQVVSTTINFTAQGHDATPNPDIFDIGAANELTVEYYTTNV